MTPNKYHSSGRLYSAQELATRAYDMLPKMVVKGYSNQALESVIRPYAPGNNGSKRQARALGYKSRKQMHRAFKRN